MSDDNGPSDRRYPRRQLRGPVEVTYSARLKFPKFHMVADCEGLDRTPEEARQTHTFPDALTMGLAGWGRPCRNCTLESTLLTTLKDRGQEKVFVTATSQANPLDPGAKLHSYKWRASTESGKARLTRVAKKLALPVVGTSVGPALYGLVPRDGAHVLRSNLRTVVKEDITTIPDPEVIEFAWTLLGDNPPELGNIDDDMDPWVLASALVS